MRTLPQHAIPNGASNLALLCRCASLSALAAALCLSQVRAQEDQLNKVHVEPPSASSAPVSEPKGTEAAPETGTASLHIHPGSFIRMNVDMVLVPVTVTDPLNRRALMGLKKEDFQVYENNGEGKLFFFKRLPLGEVMMISRAMNITRMQLYGLLK